MSNYPFKEGDNYWTIEDFEIVQSVWDSVSEEMHDEDPNKRYFYSEEEAYLELSELLESVMR